jgi:hypothetical protein
MAAKRKIRDGGSAEVFRYGGSGTVLLLALLAFVGLHPLFMGELAARLTGGLVLAVILVAGTMAASRSPMWRAIGVVLAISTFGLQATWLITGNTMIEAIMMVALAAFCLYTALVILRHVLSFGPLYADRVHAALSVYILFALFWAGAFSLIEIISPGSFLFGATPADGQIGRAGVNLLAQMFHFSIATLTSTGYGDITAVAPFARSLSQLEQLVGVFYIAVLISRLVGLYPEQDRK